MAILLRNQDTTALLMMHIVLCLTNLLDTQPLTIKLFPSILFSDAWAMKSLAKSHSKFSGRSTSLHMLLSPELHCPTCSFPESITTIFIGDKDYIHKCTNTNVWLDGDFLVGFTAVLYPYSHSSFCAPSASEKDLTHLVHVTHPKQK